jgi:hypothetical protein
MKINKVKVLLDVGLKLSYSVAIYRRWKLARLKLKRIKYIISKRLAPLYPRKGTG